jgi:hypothetical protein
MKGVILILEAPLHGRALPPSAASKSNSDPVRNQCSFGRLVGVGYFGFCRLVCDCGLPYGTRLALLSLGGRVCAAPPVRARLPFSPALRQGRLRGRPSLWRRAGLILGCQSARLVARDAQRTHLLVEVGSLHTELSGCSRDVPVARLQRHTNVFAFGSIPEIA